MILHIVYIYIYIYILHLIVTVAVRFACVHRRDFSFPKQSREDTYRYYVSIDKSGMDHPHHGE